MNRRNRLSELVNQLQDPARFEHHVEQFEQVETHVSLLLMTGPIVYKFKKPVTFNFLDYSTLAKRRRGCRREVDLNQRLAPEMYRGVVPITGSPSEPTVDGEGSVIEYAVQMKQFEDEQRLDRLVRNDGVTGAMMDRIADRVASFHEDAERVDCSDSSEAPDRLLNDVRGTYNNLTDRVSGEDRIGSSFEWMKTFLEERRNRFVERLDDGFVRDVHGDLHLENIAWYEDRPVIYDCIEFNDSLREIDLVNEVAFLAMDLERVDRSDLGWRFVNRYLERTGDYEGTVLLPFYKTYRAMVRAMVTAMKGETSTSEADRLEKERLQSAFLDQMEKSTMRSDPVLILLHGVSGSGKTTYSQQILEQLGALRVRSDVERKRLHSVPIYETPSNFEETGLDEGLYSPDATRKTYDRLKSLAADLLKGGFRVIVDATFRSRQRRSAFREMAEERGVPWVLMHFTAPEEVLRKRVEQRSSDSEPTASDAGPEVLEAQLANRDSLTEEEREHTITVRTHEDPSAEKMVRRIREQRS